ncbi:lipoprotein [Vibrio neptunius]|uniref:N-acetylmuramoyl-L-alanine amidase-like domain-containing protein n=1 Tax=Vibrio neptunius TaxID=170651 RepID=UPI0005FA253B|nr:N-acetylmuramoyl-L-alanine amidase-like domain-containing protein [Vibrio neptunius]KJY94319.1 lipoprotein [Vibrio neptunius]
MKKALVVLSLTATIIASGSLITSYLRLEQNKRVDAQEILTTIQHDNQLSIADRIVHTSGIFIGVDYKDNTLTSINSEEEVLIKDFNHVDCFTLLDYVASLAFSDSFGQFDKNLKLARYLYGNVDFLMRRHFFSDWLDNSPFNVQDVTLDLDSRAVTTVKQINQRTPDGERWIPSVPIKDKNISFIPREFIDEALIKELKNGDLIGIYSHKRGLDVSHTGIFVENGNRPIFRHASSLEGKVVDTPMLEYLKNKPGIIVYRFTTHNSSS